RTGITGARRRDGGGGFGLKGARHGGERLGWQKETERAGSGIGKGVAAGLEGLQMMDSGGGSHGGSKLFFISYIF
ncbi:hypothetical protein ACH5RR_039443, partial [Cinchona calisaya]